LFNLNQALDTPEAECFSGLTFMVLESDVVGQADKVKLERCIRL